MVGVLANRSFAAPERRSGCTRYHCARRANGLAIRFHFKLLQIGRQHSQPVRICEQDAHLFVPNCRVPIVEQGQAHGGILFEWSRPDMRIHLGGAFQYALERVCAEIDHASQ